MTTQHDDTDPEDTRPDDDQTVEPAEGSGPDADAEGRSPGNDEELADEWGKESFPGSDPPANY